MAKIYAQDLVAANIRKHQCIKCKEVFNYDIRKIKYHRHGTYDAKTVECPNCKGINILGYKIDPNIYVNNDIRYY